MTAIALTGGVGTGKSTAVRCFGEIAGERAAVFDCDASVHELLTKTAVIGKVTKIFGEEILTEDGQIDRGVLRDVVFEDVTQRRKLEAILHPEVLDAGRKAFEEASKLDLRPVYFVYEVPLLYEVEFPIEREVDLVVAASPLTQSNRLAANRGLSEEMIQKMIAAQMPIEEKIEKADMVLWNDGPESELREQIHLAIEALDERFPQD